MQCLGFKEWTALAASSRTLAGIGDNGGFWNKMNLKFGCRGFRVGFRVLGLGLAASHIQAARAGDMIMLIAVN